MITVDEIMSTSLYTLTKEDSVYDARMLMKEKNIRHIPIVASSGGLVGIVTERDLLAASESTLYATSNEERIVLEKAHQLHEIMTSKVCTIDSNDSLKSAALHMRKHKHGCLPVICDDELVGIVTDTDFVAVAVHLIEQLEESSEAMTAQDFDSSDDYDDYNSFDTEVIDDFETN
ncbi:MAG: CBS domain-containing protein [Hahellaceae bacterium]|nr:CBS domain-containing protein [Hahellaceae bacterium]MCP5210688.1 CBS domain-containing protein [Hahellaceae bacterium]